MEHNQDPGSVATQDNLPPSPDSETAPQESTPEATPPTPTPQAPPTDRYIQLLEATLRENNRTIQALQERPSNAPEPAPPAPVQADPAAFFNDPQGELSKFRKQINDDLQRTVQPLLELAKGLRGDGTPYGNLKNQFKNDPRYAQILADPKIEYAVDKIMENQQASPDMMRAAVIQASGLKMTGELDVAIVASGGDVARFQTTPVPQTPPPVSVVPSHMRPSSPAPLPTQPMATNARPLTELEKRLARERNMSDQAYLDWLSIKPGEVAASQIGRVAK